MSGRAGAINAETKIQFTLRPSHTAEPKTIWNTIEYMHANPVRRGLCLRPTDWLWSSAIEYLMPEKGLLSIDRESLPRSLRG